MKAAHRYADELHKREIQRLESIQALVNAQKTEVSTLVPQQQAIVEKVCKLSLRYLSSKLKTKTIPSQLRPTLDVATLLDLVCNHDGEKKLFSDFDLLDKKTQEHLTAVDEARSSLTRVSRAQSPSDLQPFAIDMSQLDSMEEVEEIKKFTSQIPEQVTKLSSFLEVSQNNLARMANRLEGIRKIQVLLCVLSINPQQMSVDEGFCKSLTESSDYTHVETTFQMITGQYDEFLALLKVLKFEQFLTWTRQSLKTRKALPKNSTIFLRIQLVASCLKQRRLRLS